MEASTTRIAAGFIAAFALLALNALVSYTTLGNLVTANRLVANSEQCLRLLVELRAGLSDAETGQRGFLISGDERYLEPYANARPVVTSRLNELLRLNSDDTERAARLASLEPLVIKRMQQLIDAIAARRDRAPAAAISAAN
ncbi:MAG: DNA-binding response regulator, OmpR family, containings and winged-helix, partial [Betaproteobacteria bacterium]|nr:DNA-binding response regulator, OmpR family, containings and winged-helix [Betaproteobacteria bacterium]